MTQLIYLLSAYLKTQKNYLDSRPLITTGSRYTCISFIFQGKNIEICIYNDTFIKLKVDNYPYAICDGINTLKYELDKIYTLRYQ